MAALRRCAAPILISLSGAFTASAQTFDILPVRPTRERSLAVLVRSTSLRYVGNESPIVAIDHHGLMPGMRLAFPGGETGGSEISVSYLPRRRLAGSEATLQILDAETAAWGG